MSKETARHVHLVSFVKITLFRDYYLLTGLFVLSCHTSERWYTLFTASACGTQQGVTWGSIPLLPLGEEQTNKVHFQKESFISKAATEPCFCCVCTQNRSNTLILPIHCTINVASKKEFAVRISGALKIDTLHTVSTERCTYVFASFG